MNIPKKNWPKKKTKKREEKKSAKTIQIPLFGFQ
jgi:hypothetical protein